MEKLKTKRLGWLPDIPDHRDYLFHTTEAIDLPARIDLRDSGLLPPVYDQGQLGSCTANAIAGAFEYMQRKYALGLDFPPSRLFIYYNERLIEGTTSEDAGAFIRDGMKAINQFGVCDERKQVPYRVGRFAVKPAKTAYKSALAHQALVYSRIARDLDSMKKTLADASPFVFGFSVYTAFESDAVAASGILEMPAPNEALLGGHAVLCVGYDDAEQVFIARNSWGAGWGQQGYFTIPFAYLLDENLSDDFWFIQRIELGGRKASPA